MLLRRGCLYERSLRVRKARTIGAFLLVMALVAQERAFPQFLREGAMIEEEGGALQPFCEALERAGEGKGFARLLFFGASHTASDLYTSVIRRELQRRFGDGGYGFVMPAKPWTHYRPRDIVVESTNTWHTDRVGKKDARRDGFYGLAGMSVSSSSPKDFGRIKAQRAEVFEVFYLEQPGGGHLEVLLDGGPWGKLSTAGENFRLGMVTVRTKDGPHTLEVRPVGDGEVRLFGVVVERGSSGVVLDTLAIPGSRAGDILEWDERTFKEALQRRSPNLVVLAYGTNESGDDEDPIYLYELRLRAVIGRIRSMVPKSSCLLIGPSDWPVRREDGLFSERARTALIIEVQRRVAFEEGCGFFDLQAFSGGPLSMVQWAKLPKPLAQPDLVHFTREGYELLGRTLLKALLRACGYHLD